MPKSVFSTTPHFKHATPCTWSVPGLPHNLKWSFGYLCPSPSAHHMNGPLSTIILPYLLGIRLIHSYSLFCKLFQVSCWHVLIVPGDIVPPKVISEDENYVWLFSHTNNNRSTDTPNKHCPCPTHDPLHDVPYLSFLLSHHVSQHHDCHLCLTPKKSQESLATVYVLSNRFTLLLSHLIVLGQPVVSPGRHWYSEPAESWAPLHFALYFHPAPDQVTAEWCRRAPDSCWMIE